MASQHTISWPLSGGVFAAHLQGTWTKNEVATMRKAIEQLMQVADMCAQEDETPKVGNAEHLATETVALK